MILQTMLCYYMNIHVSMLAKGANKQAATTASLNIRVATMTSKNNYQPL